MVCIACSRFGSVKLGPEQSKPEFSRLSWAAMLFAAGIGIDLMFFSVAEPVDAADAAAGRGRADDGGRAPGGDRAGRCSTTA
ncbi:BCCT family transporter [Enterobacter hormaechei]